MEEKKETAPMFASLRSELVASSSTRASRIASGLLQSFEDNATEEESIVEQQLRPNQLLVFGHLKFFEEERPYHIRLERGTHELEILQTSMMDFSSAILSYELLFKPQGTHPGKG